MFNNKRIELLRDINLNNTLSERYITNQSDLSWNYN